MREPHLIEPNLEHLRSSGFRIALDDFGAGHSSLSRLREIPADALKIDRSFLVDVPDRGDANSIVSAIVELARALGLETIAEGVENEAQHRFLLELGCDLAQGFHLGRPMSSRQITDLLRGTAEAGDP